MINRIEKKIIFQENIINIIVYCKKVVYLMYFILYNVAYVRKIRGIIWTSVLFFWSLGH